MIYFGTVNEKILANGRFIRNGFLPTRRRTPLESLELVSEHERGVELVARDTAYPNGHIYDEVIFDSNKGAQHIRLVRTTKPYNPDFMISAHMLSFFLPDIDYSKRIVTPIDGDSDSWQRFMEINRICGEVITSYYKVRGLKDFSILVGGSFNPYTDTDILRTQSVKAAHVHTLLITDAYLEETVPFYSKKDFVEFLSMGARSPSELKMDQRRFFSTSISNYFDLLVSRTLKKRIKGIDYSSFIGPIPKETSSKFPINGIKFAAEGLDFLSSPDFINVLRTVSDEIDGAYRHDLMPLFVQNYEEATTASNPESVRLEYNNVNLASQRFDERVKKLESLGFTLEEISKARKIIVKLASRLSNVSSPKFNLGPAYAFSVLYDTETNKSKIFITYSPFGGGTFDAIGLDKVWFPGKQSDYIEQRFNNSESLAIEKDLFRQIQNALPQGT